jgi:hypothetical protein
MTDNKVPVHLANYIGTRHYGRFRLQSYYSVDGQIRATGDVQG